MRCRLSVIVVVTGLVIAGASTVPAPALAQMDAGAQAQLQFNRGRELFMANNFEAALAEFRASLALAPSPNIRLYIARCLVPLHRYAEAYGEYVRAAAEASDRASTEARFAATRDTARAEAAAIAHNFGTLVVRVPTPIEGLRITAGRTDLAPGAAGTRASFDPGTVVIVATAPGRLEFRRSVEVRAGEQSELVVELAVDPHPAGVAPPQGARAQGPARTIRTSEGGTVRTVGVGVLGLGVVAIVGSAVLWVMALNAFNDCELRGCSPDQINSGEQMTTLTNMALIGGVPIAVVGAAMIMFGGPRQVERAATARGEPRSHSLRVWVAPQIGHGGGMVGVGGVF